MGLRFPVAVLTLGAALLALTAAARPAGNATLEDQIPIAPVTATLGEAPRASLLRPSIFNAVFRAPRAADALYVVAQWNVRDLTLTVVGPGAQRRTLVATTALPGHILGVRLPDDAWLADRIELNATTVTASAPPALLAAEQLADLAWRSWMYPALFGFFFTLALVHAIAACTLRSRAYGSYAVAASAAALLELPWLGIVRPPPEISQPLNAVLQTLLAAGLASFTLAYLRAAHIPRLLRAALWTAVALGAANAFGVDIAQDYWPLNDAASQLATGLFDAAMIAIGIAAVRRRTGRSARDLRRDGAVLFLAGTMLAASGFAAGLFAGVSDNPLIALAPQAGNALAALFFACALAVGRFRRDPDRAHRSARERVNATGASADTAANAAAGASAETDALTGVATRAALNAALRRAWYDACTRNAPLAALAIDVDHLGKYNAAYGDAAGDDVLRRVAATIAQAVAGDDAAVARYADDEFVVILPRTDLAGAQRCAGALTAAVGALGIAHGGVPARSVTISIGAAAIVPPHGVSAFLSPASTAGPAFAASPSACAALLARSGTALFIAKAMGRNRVVADEALRAGAASARSSATASTRSST